MQTTSFRTGAALLGAALLLMACSKPAPTEEPVRAVKVITVRVSSIQADAEFAGEVRPRVESRLGFRVAGKLVRRQAELGQPVKAGQFLAQLDPQDYRLAAEAAKAQLSLAAINRNLAEADYRRFRELKEQNFISGAELERRETVLKSAQAQLEQAQAQLSSQRNQAMYTNLVADVSGVVTAVEAEPGQVLAAGTPVVRIAQDGPRDVVFSVPEDKVAAIVQGSSVDVHVWSAGTSLKGIVREVAASADPVTRTYLVKVSLDAKAAPAIGSTVSVVPHALARSNVQVIKLPTSALKQDGKSSAVWVLDKTGMTVKSHIVQVATVDGNEAVIASGLLPGMLVVSAGVHVLSPGQKVTIYKEKQAVALESTVQTATNSVAVSAPPPRPASSAE